MSSVRSKKHCCKDETLSAVELYSRRNEAVELSHPVFAGLFGCSD